MAKSVKTSFKDTLSIYNNIVSDINNRKIAPVYLLMGDEEYFIDSICDIIEQKVLSDDCRAFNQTILYGKDCNAGSVINLARSVPMLGDNQVVIVKEAQGMVDFEKLQLYTKAPVKSTIMVLCYKGKSVDKRSVLYKSIIEHGIILESVKGRDYEVKGWLKELIHKRGLNIDESNVEILINHLGVDISKTANEITKLITFLPLGVKTITAEHIEQNIGISKEFNNFELTKALSDKNMKQAMTIVDYFSRNPKDNPVVVTISTIFNHFQKIFILNYVRWESRQKRTPMPSDMELAKIMNLTNAYFLKDYNAAAINYPNQKVFRIIGLIREYDMKSKGMNCGSADPYEILKELVIKIILL